MMELDEKSVKVDKGMELKVVEGKECGDGEVGVEGELDGYVSKCRELEESRKKDEERCRLLELEIEKRKSEFELLEAKFHELEVEKIAIEDEVKVLKSRNAELEKQIARFDKVDDVVSGEKGEGHGVDLAVGKDGEDMVNLIIENKVLECEKRSAESKAEVWKLKCRELELQVLGLQKENLIWKGGQSQLAGMMETQSEVHRKQTAKANDLKDGLDLVGRSEHLESQDKQVNNNEAMHAEIGISSTCCSPAEGIADLHVAGTPLIDMATKQFKQVEGRKRLFVLETEKHYGRRVRKQLEFGEEGSLSKKIAPSTPGVTRPSFGIIVISDGEDEALNISRDTPHSESEVNRMAHVSTDFPPEDTMGNGNKKISESDDNVKRTLLDQNDEEDVNDYPGNFTFIPTPKRKRASNIVTTDSESDSDNIPICKLKTKLRGHVHHDAVDSHSDSFSVTETVSEKVRDSATPRRRVMPLRECKVKNGPEITSPSNSHNSGANYDSRVPTDGCVENDEMEEYESEGESLGGFIVSNSDVSAGGDVSDGGDGSHASEDTSDDHVDLSNILSRFRSRSRSSRDPNKKWELLGDMLVDFANDLELCMKAVCALYRQQTTDEKYGKFTFYSNQRGFSQCDAPRGTTLAEFLIDGDPNGDLKKSAEELREYNPKAPELCRDLAKKYANQLFAIYQNKEDPFFLPS